MFARSLVFCVCLLTLASTQDVATSNSTQTMELKNISMNTTDSSNNSTTFHPDVITEELDYLKTKYTELRVKYDQWAEDPYHRTVILPGIIGAVSGITTMLLCYICCFCCGRSFCRRSTYKRNSEHAHIF